MWAEVCGFIGQPKEAVKRIQEMMRPNAHYPNWCFWCLGYWQYLAQEYEASVKTLRKMVPIGEARRTLTAISRPAFRGEGPWACYSTYRE